MSKIDAYNPNGLCYEANPNPPIIIGRSQGGSEAKIIADAPCLLKEGHAEKHKDLNGAEW